MIMMKIVVAIILDIKLFEVIIPIMIIIKLSELNAEFCSA